MCSSVCWIASIIRITDSRGQVCLVLISLVHMFSDEFMNNRGIHNSQVLQSM